jgi:demethylmenaquinone methyltransferase / 2-methoxy-6-polyprenyl-1,4-benzoquinol methylase
MFQHMPGSETSGPRAAAAPPGGEPWSGDETDFGYRRVRAAEKPRLVGAVFESVATRYDVMNDLMSLGVHRLWKAALIDRLRPRQGETLLDLAGGTGDVAFRFLERVGGHGRVIVCDFTPAMLAVGAARALDRGILEGIGWVAGDAEKLPLATASADAVTIAFGLRNVTHRDAALAEIRRVLKPGGRFICLEFSQVSEPFLARLYDVYSFAVLPLLGQVVARDRASYSYLVESIRRFPAQEALAEEMRAAGFAQVSVRNLSGGIAALHAGWRI